VITKSNRHKSFLHRLICLFFIFHFTEEIDNLTRRSKATESAFDKMTQALNDMQDPSGLLTSVMEQLNTQQQQINQLTQQVDETSKENISLDTKLQKARQEQQAAVSSSATNNSNKEEKEEIMQLRRDVAEYEVEFRSLKNQDITIRKLESRIIELQQGGEEEFKIKLEDAKQELAETEGRRTAEALEREAAMERKVETLALQLKAEKAGSAATNTHLLEASEGDYEREAAWDAQRRILVDDAERVRVMLHEATRERDDLRLKVLALDGSKEGQRSAPSSGGINVSDLLSERKAYEAEVSELSHTVNALREDISVKDTAMVDENRILQSKINVLEQEITKLNSELSETAEQLDAAPSRSLMDSMKRELRILKRLEYNADDPDMPETDPEIVGRNEDQDLESVLIAKLRRIETELVKERNQNTKLSEEAESFREEMKKLEKAKADADSVVASLEKDLDQAISSSTTPLKSSQKKATSRSVPDMAPSDPNALERVLDPDATPTPPSQPISDGSVVSDTKKSAEEKMQDDRSVANIIMSQRDRLRARCDVLEAERDSFKTELQTQVDAAESLRSDNTKLFEKMRYLQSYNNNSSNNSSNSRSGAAYSRQNSRDLDLEALEQRYEASVDPFRQFSKGERQRKLKEMTPVERTVFVVAKTMLGTKEMRTFLFFYVLSMHLLVFSTTYHWSHNDSGVDCMLMNEQLSHLPPAIASIPAVDSGGAVSS
jgi:homeobox protein cut-like